MVLVSLISGHRRPTDCEFESDVGEETPLSALANKGAGGRRWPQMSEAYVVFLFPM